MADACSFVVHCFSFHDVQHTHLHSYVPKHVLKRNKSTILSVTDVRSTIYTHAYSKNVGFLVVMLSAKYTFYYCMHIVYIQQQIYLRTGTIAAAAFFVQDLS